MAKLLDKPEPAAVWAFQQIAFDHDIGLAQNVVLSQGRHALRAMVQRIDDIYELIARPPHIQGVYLAPEIPQTLSELCYHQGVASNILFNDSQQAKDESDLNYQLRLERFRYVSTLCTNANVPRSVLSDKRVRNTLTHVDDYLMRAMRQPNTGWCIDMAIYRRDQFDNPQGLEIGFCRTFVVSEDRILHLGREISVRELRQEATAVLAGVFGVGSPPPPP